MFNREVVRTVMFVYDYKYLRVTWVHFEYQDRLITVQKLEMEVGSDD